MPSDRCPEEAEVFRSRVGSFPLADTAPVEERALQSEDRFRLAIECADHAVWNLEVRTGGGNVSPGYFRMLGYEPDRFVESYDLWCERLHPDDRQRVVPQFEDYLAGRIAAYAAEFRQRSATGDWIWIRSTGKIAARDASGQPVRVIGTFTDITELKRTQASLEESQRRLRNALRIAQLGNWTWEVETNTVWWSDEVSGLLGVDAETFEPSYEAYLSLVHPDDRTVVTDAVEAIFRGGETMEYDARIVRPDGGVVWIHSVARATRDASGGLVRLDGTDQHITQRKRTEELLRTSTERLSLILGNIADGFCVLDREWRYVEINAAGAAMVGRTRKQLIGRSLLEEFPDAAETLWGRTYASVMKTGRAKTVEGFYEPLGKWFEARVRPHDGGVAVLFSDISERKAAESQLRDEQSFTKAILENAGALIVVLDRQGRICRFNRAAEQLSGYQFSEVKGQFPWDVVLPPESAEIVRREAFEAMMSNPSVVGGGYTNEWMTRGGERRLIDWYNTRIHDKDGPSEFMVSVGVDVTERHQAVSALRESEAKLRAIFESEPECVKVLDAEGRLLEMNPAGLSMIGAESIDAVRGLPITEVICPEYREEFRQGVADVFRGQQTLQELDLVSLDGVRRHVEQRAVGLRDPLHPERILQMLAVTRDVSERRRMEEREARRVEKLKLLSESALPLAGEPDDVFENVLRIISDVFDVRIVCLSTIDGQDLVLRSAWIDGQLQRNVGRCPLAATPCGGAVASRRVWIVDRVAERFPDAAFLQEHQASMYCGSPVICTVGNVVGVVFLLDDKAREFSTEDEHLLQLFGQRVALEFDREKGLAARRDAEEVLLQNQRRLSEAQRIAHIGDWMWELSTDAITWSDEVYRIFGHEPQSFVPRYEVEFLQTIHPDDRESVVAAVASSLDSGTPYQIVHRIVLLDGSERTVRERGEASYDAAGLPIRMVGTVQDITESTFALEQMEILRSELAHVARLGMLGEIVAGIAHELNQPLAAIANNAFTVRRTLEKLPRTASGALLDNALSFTQEIETQSVRGGDIIRRLMTLLRKTGSHRSTVSLRRLIDEVLFLLATEIRVTQVDVDIAVPEDLPEIIVDAVQIQQVLFNVIRNAIEAMTGQSRGRQLRIHAELKSGRAILVRILDTGPGFSADIERRIFTPFATTKSDGLGFGLAITKRIVEAHGGEIGIRSKFGDGAEVRFTLPTSGVAGEDVNAR